jgi:hypothetical protein
VFNTNSSEVVAAFHRDGEPSRANVQHSGRCSAFDSNRFWSTIDAGVVSVSSGQSSVAVPNLGSVYTSMMVPTPFVPGNDVTFVGAGGEFPAFELPVYLPQPTTIRLSPDPMTTPWSVQRRIEVSWTPTEFDVLVSIQRRGVAADGTSRFLECWYSGGAGSATIDSGALQLLGAGHVEVSVRTACRNATTIGAQLVVATAATTDLNSTEDFQTDLGP